MICPRCHKQIYEDLKACPHCNMLLKFEKRQKGLLDFFKDIIFWNIDYSNVSKPLDPAQIDVENFFDDILNNPNQMDAKFMKKLFHSLVERVTVNGDDVDIQVVYRVSPFVVAPRWTCLKAKLSPIYNRIDLRHRA